MSAYMDLTAAELAGCLDLVPAVPHNTGALSMVDEATIAYGSRFPEIDAAQRAFADARHAHKRSYRTETGGYSEESWQAAVEAAHRLADALRPLGDFRIARCSRPAGWGTCDLPLDDDGVCRSSLGHTDEQGKRLPGDLVEH